MAMVSNVTTFRKSSLPEVVCRRREKDKGQHNNYPYKVIEITPPPKSLGVRCFPSLFYMIRNGKGLRWIRPGGIEMDPEDIRRYWYLDAVLSLGQIHLNTSLHWIHD